MSAGRSLQPASLRAPKTLEVPSWKKAYEKTEWEMDVEKLLPLIHATELALVLRGQEIRNNPVESEELSSMKAAAEDLLAIKIHRLGWPDPYSLPRRS
jgi:hypothetical protein